MTNATPAWTARTGTTPAAELVEYGACVDEDELLIQADLVGSIAHTVALHEADLVTTQEASMLIQGLQALAHDFQQGELRLDPQLEDVHMNVEHLLEDEVGAVAKKLHTGRSRNDQVALDLTLFQQDALVDLAANAHALATALLETAIEHASTPWPLHTHGLPGQPATLGYLLHAHALRFAQDAERILGALEATKTSPLGAGAGAGSTLPIDPATTGELLGLDPFQNGLLATGARDGCLEATNQAATAGHHAQDLATDLIELTQQGALELPSAYTTGSSIMPHKKNPDALELARADGQTLTSLHQQAQALTQGLGLGYQRDYQRAKPPTLEALTLAPQVLSLLAAVVDGLDVHPSVLEDVQNLPGVSTTDAAEALVEHGIPFRQAHQALAQACNALEHGASFEAVLGEALTENVASVAIEALDADPSRRDTPGGPAPEQVLAAADHLEARLASVNDELSEAKQGVQARTALLEASPEALLETSPEVVAS